MRSLKIKKQGPAGIYQYVFVVLIIGLTTLICSLFTDSQGYHVVSLLLLFIVSILAIFLGIGPVLLASTLSAVVWNYFFIPPFHTFNIAKTEDQLMFGSFFIIALVNGVLTNRISRQERLVREREDQTKALFHLAGELSKARGINEVVDVARNDIKQHFNAEAFFFLQNGNNKLLNGEIPDNNSAEPHLAAINWVLKHNHKAGKFTVTFPEVAMTYFPLAGTRTSPGVCAIELQPLMYEKKEAFWDTYMTQISNALEREFLGELALKAGILNESDKLYKTLFNLISHEFRIPIATIMGASDTLLLPETSEKNREELYNEIFKASARLNHLIDNLLNMSRLEGGKIALHLDWCDINDLINNVLQNLKQELALYQVKTIIPEDLPLIRIDFGLMEHVLYNLLLNACQNSPPSTQISIEADYLDGSFLLIVSDEGSGFPAETIPRIFDKFFRTDNSKTGGLGLGLSIVKGLVEAHKGTVKVENRNSGGAKFTITIPSEIPDMENFNLAE